jgi:parallel beta-helix repeat protein
MIFRIIRFFRIFFLSIFALAGLTISTYCANYYVSSINGNDNNAGTSSSAPWKSIERLKRVLSSLQVGDKVYLEKGSEWDNVSLRLSNLTGTSLNPIVFTTYGTGSQPRIKGSKVISSFTQNGNIWRKVDNSLPDYKATSRRVIPFVYINNKRYEVSRYPNTGYLTALTFRGVKDYLDATSESWTANYWKNALAVVRSVNWIWDTRRINSNTSSRLYFDEIGNDYERESSPFLIRNHVHACDQNGEWAQQNDTLWICYSGDINQQKVEFPAIDTMIRITNCKYVRFSGISIERANMFTLHCKGSIITLENCNFSDSGGGLILATDNSNVNVTGNTLKYGRRGGIYLEKSHGTISKNKFKQFAFVGADNTERTFGASVANWYCDAKTIVSQNVFDSVNIAYHGHWSNADNYFTKNMVTNYAMTIRDCGAVYFGSDFTDYKKYVTRNIIDYAVDDFSHGIYIDYNTHNVIADSNSISRSNCAIFVHVSDDNSIKYNNIVDPSIIMVDPWNSAVRFDEYDYNQGNNEVSPIETNELLHNNIVLGTGTNETAVMYFNVTNCGANKIDYNNYFDPFSSDPNIIYNGKDYSSYWMYSLDEWKPFSGLDQNSTFNKTNWFYKSDLNIPKEDFVLLVTNPTNQEIKYDLRYRNAEYIDVNGIHYSQSINIPAYYSVILFYYKKVLITNSDTISDTTIAKSTFPYKICSVKAPCNSSDFFDVPLIKTTVDTLKDCIGFDFVLTYDKNKVMPTGKIQINNDLVDSVSLTEYSAGIYDTLIAISLYLNAGDPSGVKFSGTGQVLAVEFRKTMNFKTGDTARFAVSSLMESYATSTKSSLVEPGTFSTYCDSAFKGALRFWYDNSPITYDKQNQDSTLITNIFVTDTSGNRISVTALQPDLSGNFEYSTGNGKAIQIERDIPGETDMMPVINGIDVQMVRKVLIQDNTFIPNIYQIIAMDVNMDGQISAGDITQMNERTMSLTDEYQQAWNFNNQGVSNGTASKDWLFIPCSMLSGDASFRISATYPYDDHKGYSKFRVPMVPNTLPLPVENFNNSQQINNEVYRGILLGDVDGNYRKVASITRLKSTTGETNNKVIFDLSFALIQNNYIDVPISILSDIPVYSLDFALKLNEKKIRFQSVVDHSDSMQYDVYYNNKDKILRLTSNSLQQFNIDKSLLTLRFTIISDQPEASDILSAKVYLNGEPEAYKVKEHTLTITVPGENHNTDAVKIYPNPASSFLFIETPAKATVQVIDITGDSIYGKAILVDNNTYRLDVQDLHNGIYLVKIQYGNVTMVKKVIINH